jgi:cytochrome b6
MRTDTTSGPDRAPPRNAAARLMTWLFDRLGAEALLDLAKKKDVPVHRHTFWYYVGGMTLFLFIVQVVTGILLLLYYRPSPSEAWESVRFITAEVSFGWLIRDLHCWSANVIMGVMALHLASVFFLGAYRPPRELTWITGVMLAGLLLAFGFTGYLLPWNQLSVFATKVGTEIPGKIPVVGGFLQHFMRGGPDVTGGTLTRLFGFHVAVLPMLMAVTLGVHLYLVQLHGMSVPLSQQKKPPATMKFFPDFMLRDMVGWLAMLGILAVLSVISPWDIGQKADLFQAPSGAVKPEWYFLFMFQALKILPARIFGIEGELVGIAFFSLAGLALVMAPFLDREGRQDRTSRTWRAAGVIAVLFAVAFTLWGWLA